MSTSLVKFTLWAAPALQTARETPRIALAPSFATNTRKHMSGQLRPIWNKPLSLLLCFLKLSNKSISQYSDHTQCLVKV